MIYTGVGSRKTPEDVMKYMTKVAKRMAELGWTLRTGGAIGADQAFLDGALEAGGKVELFLPWTMFQDHHKKGYSKNISLIDYPSTEARDELRKHVDERHFRNLQKGSGMALHSRNVHQVMGYNLAELSDLVLCWTPLAGPWPTGGTATAIKIGRYYKVPTYNLFERGMKEEFEKHMRNLLSIENAK